MFLILFFQLSAEIHMFGTSIFWWRLVMFLSDALVTPESFQVESTRVLFLVSTV